MPEEFFAKGLRTQVVQHYTRYLERQSTTTVTELILIYGAWFTEKERGIRAPAIVVLFGLHLHARYQRHNYTK